MSRPSPVTICVLLCLVVLLIWLARFSGNLGDENRLVVYCAHDLMFAQQVVDDFERETGIRVHVVGDTEATKSLGLVERIIRERSHPVCDLFWNNQVLSTIKLQRAGLLQPYQGPGYQRIPQHFKDAQGYWAGFGGRFRVWIVNTDLMQPSEAEIEARMARDDLSDMAMALPLYGTTLSHYAVLWSLWGPEKLIAWHHDLVKRGCRIAPGNATVKNLVADGACAFGLTDEDDFFVALDEGKPVAMLPVRVAGKAICIPNSLAIIRGARHPEAARRFADYLLSEQVELRLAHSQARQVPLGPVDQQALPDEVRALAQLVPQSHPIADFADAQQECLDWLKSIYVP